jgi:hypothetical protein
MGLEIKTTAHLSVGPLGDILRETFVTKNTISKVDLLDKVKL